MKTILPNTSTAAEHVLVGLLRTTTVSQRLKMVEDLNESLRVLAFADLRRCYPGATEKELRRRLAARILRREEVIAAYGWDPEVEGY